MKKENGKIRVLTCLFVLALIGLGLLGYYAYTLKKASDDANAKVKNLEEQVANLNVQIENENNSNPKEEKVENRRDKEIEYVMLTENIDGLDGLYITEVEENDDDTLTLKGIFYTKYTMDDDAIDGAVSTGYIILDGVKYYFEDYEGDAEDIEYELKAEDSEEALYQVSSVEPNVHRLYRNAQLRDVWMFTGVYGMVTVDKDVIVVDDFSGNIETEAGEYFADWKNEKLELTEDDIMEKTILDAEKTYAFEFKDGKCTQILNVLTSI